VSTSSGRTTTLSLSKADLKEAKTKFSLIQAYYPTKIPFFIQNVGEKMGMIMIKMVFC
jgi:hypothetical protein